MSGRLLRASSGAVFVMTTFVALFLAAVVYHVAAVGEAALEQQVMQDAADATVFSAATANARGMNLLSLINLIMAAVLAVLVALRLIQSLLIVATVIFAAMCAIPYTSAVGCSLAEVTADLTIEIDNAVDEVEPIVQEILEAMNETAGVVNDVVPYLAEAEAVYVSTSDEYSPPSTVGFVWPVFDGLPTREGEFDELCEKASENVVDVAFFYLSEGMKDAIGDMVGDLATTFSSFYCGGDDSSKRPTVEKKMEVSHPWKERGECSDERHRIRVGAYSQCEDDGGGGGTASNGCDCEGSAACEGCSEDGCETCWKALGASKYASGLWTRSTESWVEQRPDGGEWAFERWDRRERRAAVELKDDPCRKAGRTGGCWTGSPSVPLTVASAAPGGPPPPAPPAVCVIEEEDDPYTDAAGTEHRRVARTSWLYLHSCKLKEKVVSEAGGEPIEGGSDMAPREIDPERFDEDSKLRSLLIGSGQPGRRRRQVALAAAEHAEGGGGGGRISFAAAEFGSRTQDLWHMNWQARLIRFRLSYGDSGSSTGAGPFGAGGGGDCMEGFEEVCGVIDDGLAGLDFASVVESMAGDLDPRRYILH